MQPTTCEGAAVAAASSAPGSAEPDPEEAETPQPSSENSRHRGAESGEERQAGLGVQVWPDGSRYEGEFANGLKHGRGRYTWADGEVINVHINKSFNVAYANIIILS